MGDWWYRNIEAPGKLPLLLALAVFVIVFLVTRGVTRMIRAGVGPFRNIGGGRVHVHHMVPGVVLAAVGGFGMAAAPGQGWGRNAMAMVFGAGMGLVMDEFALMLYLTDVYWSPQGRASVEAVVLTAAAVGMVLLGVSPLGVENIGVDQQNGRTVLVLSVVAHFLVVVVAFAKGKLRSGVLGVFLPPVAWIAAVRLARPGSLWAHRRYPEGSRRRRRAGERERRHDARWGRLTSWASDLLAGRPDRG
ncbi:hypothetical protein [Streptomyces zingiberis]|uniref:Integral membrane protein n=1 Tax=Streptomyces zingiberis TaxID=2053010 RepID=A0ABX1BPN5_9ACTN|nr:hypothetical protein [Streptomyces zingiberis]NJP99690.1 hypothetical protein [Streptomyces zingiberis]